MPCRRCPAGLILPVRGSLIIRLAMIGDYVFLLQQDASGTDIFHCVRCAIIRFISSTRISRMMRMMCVERRLLDITQRVIG